MNKYLTTSPWLTEQITQCNIIDENDLRMIHSIGHRKQFRKGDLIHQAGMVCVDVYYVLKGVIRNSFLHQNGLEKVVSYETVGCFVGISSYFHQQPTMYSAVASEDLDTIHLTGANVEEMLARVTLARIFLRQVSFSARVLAAQVEDLAFRNAVEKVCRLLYYIQAGRRESPETIHQQGKITQNELANVAGVHRVSITNAISLLKNEGLVDIRKDGSIVIKDLELLRQRGFGM